ncbi:hypothetical protein PENSPDRAFT_271603 [Peniophora sp. CONT]|nr:hypothetical protein PENSPDRAFT_271603 [Peniophora sp. CONT]
MQSPLSTSHAFGFQSCTQSLLSPAVTVLVCSPSHARITLSALSYSESRHVPGEYRLMRFQPCLRDGHSRPLNLVHRIERAQSYRRATTRYIVYEALSLSAIYYTSDT